ncbi:BfmA/BtgA family mobilization protein [Christiangramia fulva]|nr:BfmA/BtgA family mobilization protein [Christiangramia fulva]
MDDSLKKEKFRNLSFKSSVAEKFIRYSKEISRSRSMTLLLMLEFFEFNKIAPTESLGPRMQTLESVIKKRINALMAIIRDIEQNQTIPTKGMLEALFEELPGQNPKKNISSFQEAFKNLNAKTTTVPLKPKEPDHKDIRKLLRHIKTVQPTFGKPFLKITISPQEINHLKSKYHVYHD